MLKKKLLVIISSVLLITITCLIIYLNTYYHSDNVDNYLVSNEEVIVKKINEGYFFDGKGNDIALIFYPGAKVEYISYAPLMNKLASNGIDTFLIEMPFNIAFFDKNKAGKIINKYNYDNWYLSGHSLGGVVISLYAINNSNNIDGLILLASYPTKKIPDNIKLLSIIGKDDGVLNLNKYNSSKKYFPTNTTELFIDGNHSNFGNYGMQKKDKQSSITKNEQQDETINEIIKFIKD